MLLSFTGAALAAKNANCANMLLQNNQIGIDDKHSNHFAYFCVIRGYSRSYNNNPLRLCG